VSCFSQAIQELRTVSISDYEDRVEDVCLELESETWSKGLGRISSFRNY